ncbi:homocysteine S-methyltransferase family protein [Massiliimalia massiliensis]|uniref:homocysteine S-methyltransferase family protein n=1 Tax=Massiliimalia massiliensis TaxID=1852384 RepID=UPI000985D6D6|nr:homocysteine S-methyltransferase family protein [Massiliimalia massiliensis]
MLKNFDHVILLDGAMGTMLQKSGVRIGKVPEALNITHPDIVIDIHRQYIESGSDIIYSNTFSANRYKLAHCGYTVDQLVTAGVKNAKRAAEGTKVKAALSIGPVGELLEPNGNLSFDSAYDIFREMLIAGEKAGADLVVFETMTDLLEMKAAVLAAKENTSLPVFCTMTFEENHRTFTGVSVESMAVTLTSLGVEAIGVNCSLGPKEILPIAQKLSRWTPLPIIIKANAGLPNLNSNTYDISAEEFAETMREYLHCGVSIIGGCCGTTPGYIRELARTVKGQPVSNRDWQPRSVLCSASHLVEVDGVRIIGERINPTGKKLFKEALINHNTGYILTQGLEQVKAGADILDVNVGLPEIDEKQMMLEVVKGLQSVLDAPLQIDSSNPSVIESALRIYNGKAIVNSVNGERKVLDRILPVVKKYGAAVVGLTMDETGIPNAAEDRFAIARRIVEAAEEYGIPREDIYIDCLTLTASVQQKEVQETLKAVKMAKEQLGVKTVLGVSNISFGLPNRELINHSFLLLAMAHGLDCPIINPNIKSMMDAVDAYNVLYNRDVGSKHYIEKHHAAVSAPQPKSKQDMTLSYAVVNGLKEAAGEITGTLLQTMDPLAVINEILIPSLDQVGNDFEKGIIFLPQLIQSATAAQAGFDQIKLALAKQPAARSVSKGKIVLATVKGDVHDIGKNIVRVILENYGYDVIDLGKDVPVETVVQETKRSGAKLVGLSALMTTTVVSMQQTIEALHQSGADCKIWVGGAVLTEDYAMKIGADFYAKDAKQSADIAKKVLG